MDYYEAAKPVQRRDELRWSAEKVGLFEKHVEQKNQLQASKDKLQAKNREFFQKIQACGSCR